MTHSETTEPDTLNRSDPLPELVFTDEPLADVLGGLVSGDTLLVVDAYNLPAAMPFAPPVVVDRCHEALLDTTRGRRTWGDVVAVGGCSALDFGRCCAAKDIPLIAIPSILSTSCISVDHSVVYSWNDHRYVRTQAPHQVLVSLPLLMSGAGADIHKWSQSGCGDLFANLSAAVDFCFRAGRLSDSELRRVAPEAFDGIDWLLGGFTEFDEEALRVLARLLHEASLRVIRTGDASLSAAGEHQLFFALETRLWYSKSVQTHGRLVALGTCLSLLAASRITGDASLLENFRAACHRLSLPLSYRELRDIGVWRRDLIAGLKSLASNGSFLGDEFGEHGADLLDECFD